MRFARKTTDVPRFILTGPSSVVPSTTILSTPTTSTVASKNEPESGQVAVTFLPKPTVVHLVVNVGPVPVAGVPAGSVVH